VKNKGFVFLVINIGNWIVHLAYINVLWFLHSAIGLFILGVFPSTVALFSIIRQRLKHGSVSAVWSTYHKAFKDNFVSSNVVGYLYMGVGIITYVDFKFLQLQDSMIFITLSYSLLIFLLIYGVMGLFLFPMLTHYELKILHYFKYTFIIMVSHPANLLLTIIGLIVIWIVMLFIPGLLLFYGLSIPAYIIMWSNYRVYKKIDMKISEK